MEGLCLGLPNTSVLKSAIVRRVVKFHIHVHPFQCTIGISVDKLSLCCTDCGNKPLPLWLYSFSAPVAIVFVASLPILLTATLFTIEQMFLRYPDFRLTGREAVWQAVGLLLISHWGVALFLSCICFLLLLSKAGKTVQNVSGVASFLMSHVILTALPLLMHSLIRFIRNIHLINQLRTYGLVDSTCTVPHF